MPIFTLSWSCYQRVEDFLKTFTRKLQLQQCQGVQVLPVFPRKFRDHEMEMEGSNHPRAPYWVDSSWTRGMAACTSSVTLRVVIYVIGIAEGRSLL